MRQVQLGDDIDYSKWTMVDDPTIRAHGPAYGVEIVSLIIVSDVGTGSLECRGDWQNDIPMLWGLIEYWFDVVTGGFDELRARINRGRVVA
jgi:hypothetical protein